MQQNVLEKLYPHLRFNQIRPANRSLSEPPPVKIELPSVSQKPEITEKIIEAVVNDKPPTPKKESPKKPLVEIVHKKEKKVKITETPMERPRPVEHPEPLEQPIRTSQIPNKGEKGLQRKYSTEQRKSMYLDKLSRKSVKRAELEVNKVNEVLEKVEHSQTRLKNEERDIKNRLKLINTAKLFLYDKASNINESPNASEKQGLSPKRCKERHLSEELNETRDERQSDRESSSE